MSGVSLYSVMMDWSLSQVFVHLRTFSQAQLGSRKTFEGMYRMSNKLVKGVLPSVDGVRRCMGELVCYAYHPLSLWQVLMVKTQIFLISRSVNSNDCGQLQSLHVYLLYNKTRYEPVSANIGYIFVKMTMATSDLGTIVWPSYSSMSVVDRVPIKNGHKKNYLVDLN